MPALKTKEAIGPIFGRVCRTAAPFVISAGVLSGGFCAVRAGVIAMDKKAAARVQAAANEARALKDDLTAAFQKGDAQFTTTQGARYRVLSYTNAHGQAILTAHESRMIDFNGTITSFSVEPSVTVVMPAAKPETPAAQPQPGG